MKVKDRVEEFGSYLDELYPTAICELQFQKDYELLMAVVMSAQTTDRRVNSVTPILFRRYPTLKSLYEANIEDIMDIIKPIGNVSQKSRIYSKDCIYFRYRSGWKSSDDRTFLETLPGVGRKTVNVVLSVLYDEPAIAVDTHVERVSKRLGFAKEKDSVLVVEQKLMKLFPKELWSKRHHQMFFRSLSLQGG